MSDLHIVSVVVPFYRELNLVERAIQSVVGQLLPMGIVLEVLIGNDSEYSEKQIREVLSDSSNRITTIWHNAGARGAGNARNSAIAHATGGILAFLDADDYWLPDKLGGQLPLIHQGASFVAGYYRFEGTNTVVKSPYSVTSTFELLCNTNVGTSTVLIRRDLLGEDRFRNYLFSQDTDLWARLAGKDGFFYLPYKMVATIYSPSGRTANKLQQFLHFRKIVIGFSLSFRQRVMIYARYTLRGFFNHYLGGIAAKVEKVMSH